MSVGCSMCAAVADPSIYRPGVMTVGGDFGKCPSCGRVFCGSCRKTIWLDTAKTMWMGHCPDCNTPLKADIHTPSRGGHAALSIAKSLALLAGVALVAGAGILYGLMWTAEHLVPDFATMSIHAWMTWGVISLAVGLISFVATVAYYRYDDGFFDTDEMLRGLRYGAIVLGAMLFLKLLAGTFN